MNEAFVSYAIEGPKEILQKIEKALILHPIKENSSSSWEGNVLIALHDNSAIWMPKKEHHMRGFINEESWWWDNNTGALRFDAVESGGVTDFDEELKELFPEIKVFWTVNSDDDELYATNDKEGKYFKDRYYIDTCIKGDYQSDYFTKEQDALAWIAKITGRPFASFEEVEDYSNDLAEECLDDFINVHIFNVV